MTASTEEATTVKSIKQKILAVLLSVIQIVMLLSPIGTSYALYADQSGYGVKITGDASIIDYTLCHMSRVLVASSFSLIGYFMTLPVVKAISYMQEVKVRKILTGGATLLVILGCYNIYHRGLFSVFIF